MVDFRKLFRKINFFRKMLAGVFLFLRFLRGVRVPVES
jgi:hypothetical protein